jgi:putative sterol carrier protein
MASTPAEFFAAKNEQLQSKGAELASINSIYQFSLTGDDGGDWVIELTDAAQEVREGLDENAKCAITMTSSDFMGMIDGSLNPQMAFMTGKLKVKGDMSLALKLQAVLN